MLTIEDALLRADDNTVTDLPATTLHADNLNLHYDGVESVKDFNGNFSFTDAVVGKNLDVTYKGGDNKLKLANSFELKAYTPSTTVNNQTTHAVAQDGTITGNDFILTGTSGSISVENGHWTATPNITLASGASISVGLNLDEDNSNAVYANTTDSSLALNGGLTFDLKDGNSSVKASGLTSYNPLLEDREAKEYSAQLDLTGGLAVINHTSSNSGSITAESGGVVTLNASDVNAILDADAADANSATSLTNLALLATTNGAIQAVNGNVSANFTDFGNSDSAVAGKINLSR